MPPSRAPALPESPPSVKPSAAFYRDEVDPLLRQSCAFCHRGGRGGALDLSFGAVSGGEGPRIERNFKAVLRFIDTASPASSPLLRKGIPQEDGGLPHADAPYLQPGSPLEIALRDFVAGGTAANRPPQPQTNAPRVVPPGRPVLVDASASRDPEGAPLAFHWSLARRPAASATLLGGSTGATVAFTPDAEGDYVLRLRCGDGTLEAVPLLIRIVADGRAGAATASSPAQLDPAPGPGGMDDSMGGSMSADDTMGSGDTMGGGAMGNPTATELSPLAGISDRGPALTGGGTPVDDGEGPPLDTPTERLRYARGVFFDLRGRGPTPGELSRSLRSEPEALVDSMLAEPATWSAWLDAELYYYLLIDRFRPVSERVLALPALMARGEADFREATREIVVSAEFNVRNPGNDTFVTVVLEQLLGMVVQDHPKVLAAGKKLHDGIKYRFFGQIGANQSDIVRIVMEQPQFTDLFVRRQYARLFGLPMPDAAATEAAARLREEPGALRTLYREWLLSRAYRLRTLVPRVKGDLVFIRTLFTDLLRREPTFEEFRNMRNAFLALSDPAPVRNVLAQLLLETPEAKVPTKESLKLPDDWVRRQFLDLLGRPPADAEREAFVTTLGEYGCEPRTLMLALVTSPHYQYY